MLSSLSNVPREGTDAGLRHKYCSTPSSETVLPLSVFSDQAVFSVHFSLLTWGDTVCVCVTSSGPVYHEYCDCPEEDPQAWQETLSCPATEPQIEQDFAAFPSINLLQMLKEVPKRFGDERGAVVHYTIVNNHIHRRSLGKYTDFKMFSDEILLSLARKV